MIVHSFCFKTANVVGSEFHSFIWCPSLQFFITILGKFMWFTCTFSSDFLDRQSFGNLLTRNRVIFLMSRAAKPCPRFQKWPQYEVKKSTFIHTYRPFLTAQEKIQLWNLLCFWDVFLAFLDRQKFWQSLYSNTGSSFDVRSGTAMSKIPKVTSVRSKKNPTFIHTYRPFPTAQEKIQLWNAFLATRCCYGIDVIGH